MARRRVSSMKRIGFIFFLIFVVSGVLNSISSSDYLIASSIGTFFTSAFLILFDIMYSGLKEGVPVKEILLYPGLYIFIGLSVFFTLLINVEFFDSNLNSVFNATLGSIFMLSVMMSILLAFRE